MLSLVKYHVFPWVESPWDDRVQEMLDSWLKTKYVAAGAAKGIGVDCVRFIACGLNELEGRERKRLDRLPRDTAFHKKSKAIAALKKFLTIYGPYEKVMTEGIESGDVVVVQPDGAKGPGHALFASSKQNILYHANPPCVQDIHIHDVGLIHAIYRVTYKEKWLNAS